MNHARAQQTRVLFVDDEENILNAVKRLLIDEPLDVLTAGSGEDALGLLKSSRDVAVIVSDQRMPAMSGAEFLEKSRDIAPDAVRIVLTGYADVKAVMDAINKGGAYRYISKPWNDEELISIIRDAVSRYALGAENKRLTEIVHRQNAELKKWNSQLETFVQQQTIEIRNKNVELGRFNERLRSNFRHVIGALSGLLELRDKASLNHSRNVSEAAARAARALDLSEYEIEQVTTASLLHDIGKIGIADILFSKNYDEMTQDERAEYEQHPVLGQAAVGAIEDLQAAGILIRHHHEAIDGSGWPDGLKGDEIPLGARIIAAADRFDRAFMSLSGPHALDTAFARFREMSGSILDPDVCRALEGPLREKYSVAVASAGAAEREIPLRDLAAGMIVSRDVKSGTGILLLSKGAMLDAKNIQALRRYGQVDPLRSGVFVVLQDA